MCLHNGRHEDAEEHEVCIEQVGHDREHSNSLDQSWFIKFARKGETLSLEDRIAEIRCDFARGRGLSPEYLANQYGIDCMLEAIKLGIIEKPRLSIIEDNPLLYPPEPTDQ